MAFVKGSKIFLLMGLSLVSFSVSSPPLQFTLDALYDRVNSLTSAHSDITTLSTIGKSVENRPIYAVKIHKGSPLFAVVLQFGIQARELASPALSLYLMEKLITNPDCGYILNRIRWYIIPVLNPDGYNYAVNTGKPWRKNRAPIPLQCVGVDLNSNFPEGWELVDDDSSFCQETYRGENSISEPESMALKDFLDVLVQREYVKAYIAVDACAAGIFYPYGYKKEKAADHDPLESVGKEMQSAIENVAKSTYIVGPAYSSGVSGGRVDDWVYENYHIPLVYTFELGGSNSSSSACFKSTPADTDRLTREFFAGVQALAYQISPEVVSEDKSKCLEVNTGRPAQVEAVEKTNKAKESSKKTNRRSQNELVGANDSPFLLRSNELIVFFLLVALTKCLNTRS